MGTRIAAPALGVWRVIFCERRAGLVFMLPRAGPWSFIRLRFAQPQFLATIPSLKPKPKRSQTLLFVWSQWCLNRGGPLIFARFFWSAPGRNTAQDLFYSSGVGN